MTCRQENENNDGWQQIKMFTCPYCHGMGYWYTTNIPEQKRVKVICNACDGDGVLTVYQDLPGFED